MVVHRPRGGPGREVSVAGTPAGRAYSLADVVALVRRVGIDLDPGEALATSLIEWRGAGADSWGPGAG